MNLVMVIAVDFPNRSTLTNHNTWGTYTTSSTAIEGAVRATFFANLK